MAPQSHHLENFHTGAAGFEHGNALLNLQCDEDENPSTQSDVNGLLSTKVVDVPRFELGASTMPR